VLFVVLKCIAVGEREVLLVISSGVRQRAAVVPSVRYIELGRYAHTEFLQFSKVIISLSLLASEVCIGSTKTYPTVHCVIVFSFPGVKFYIWYVLCYIHH